MVLLTAQKKKLVFFSQDCASNDFQDRIYNQCDTGASMHEPQTAGALLFFRASSSNNGYRNKMYRDT